MAVAATGAASGAAGAEGMRRRSCTTGGIQPAARFETCPAQRSPSRLLAARLAAGPHRRQQRGARLPRSLYANVQTNHAARRPVGGTGCRRLCSGGSGGGGGSAARRPSAATPPPGHHRQLLVVQLEALMTLSPLRRCSGLPGCGESEGQTPLCWLACRGALICRPCQPWLSHFVENQHPISTCHLVSQGAGG